MGHDHHHEHDESYFQDQLVTIVVCGAFAGAAIVLYYWQPQILNVMGFGGGSLFSSFIVWSGFALLVLVILRAISLWKAVARPAPAAACAHAHAHEHSEHDHHDGGCDHEHHHGHEHVHSTVRCSSGHEHGAAPWRYVVLLVPIVLFLLGLPNKPPKAHASEIKVGQTDMLTGWALAGVGPLPLQQLVLVAATADPSAGTEVKGMDFKVLEGIAQDEYLRKDLQGKMVRVVGQFAPHPRSDHDFSLVRYRVQCCAADAIQYAIPALCRESFRGIPANQWVEVTGRVQFQRHPSADRFVTVLIVPQRKNIVLTNPDPNPYIQ
jgi:hypothetical protein